MWHFQIHLSKSDSKSALYQSRRVMWDSPGCSESFCKTGNPKISLGQDSSIPANLICWRKIVQIPSTQIPHTRWKTFAFQDLLGGHNVKFFFWTWLTANLLKISATSHSVVTDEIRSSLLVLGIIVLLCSAASSCGMVSSHLDLLLLLPPLDQVAGIWPNSAMFNVQKNCTIGSARLP